MSRYKTITIVAAVPTFGYALGHFTTTAMLSGEANSLLFLRNTVGLVVGSGILWASMSVWAGRVAGPRLWRSILAGTVIIFAMLAIHYAFGLLIGVFDDQIFSSNALWMYGSFISGPTFGLIGGLSHKFPWLLLIVPLGLIAEPFVINSIPARVSPLAHRLGRLGLRRRPHLTRHCPCPLSVESCHPTSNLKFQ